MRGRSNALNAPSLALSSAYLILTNLLEERREEKSVFFLSLLLSVVVYVMDV